MKKTLILLFLSLFVFQASAQSIGSLSYESTKKAPLTAEYEIGVFNLKNETINIELSSRDFNGDVEFEEEKFDIETSEVSSNPEGSGWISVSGNKYVKPRKVKFTVKAENSQNFTVQVKASRTGSNEGSGPQVVQVLSHGFTYIRTSDTPVYGESGYEDQNESELELGKKERESSETEDSGNNDNSSGALISIPDPSEEKNQENNSIDPITMLLTLGAAGSLYYLWSVI